jgi:hypothetical protein
MPVRFFRLPYGQKLRLQLPLVDDDIGAFFE